jgi:hypothetical protein
VSFVLPATLPPIALADRYTGVPASLVATRSSTVRSCAGSSAVETAQLRSGRVRLDTPSDSSSNAASAKPAAANASRSVACSVMRLIFSGKSSGATVVSAAGSGFSPGLAVDVTSPKPIEYVSRRLGNTSRSVFSTSLPSSGVSSRIEVSIL